MGGRGSGRTGSFGTSVDKCNEFHSVDLAWLRRQKLLNVGRWSTVRWSRGGQETGSIKLAYLGEGICLSYRQRQSGGEWQDVREIVPLIQTDTQFGGKRQWFKCLSCGKRCRILFGGVYFRCRKCHRLRYDTQYEPPFARAATRALKIRESLGCKGGIDDFFPPKPKGMHWKTYRRLEEREEQLQNAWAIGIAAKFRLFEPK